MTTTTEVPYRFPVAIDGVPFQIDPEGFRRESIPVTREQSDDSNEPADTSFNRRSLWRRSQDSWHHGAGQNFLDGRQGGTTSDTERYSKSHGIDPWTRGQVSLLNNVTKIKDLTPGLIVGSMIVAGNYVYSANDNAGDAELIFFNNPSSTGDVWTVADTITGTGITSITTDGNSVWYATSGGDGIWHTPVGVTTPNTLIVDTTGMTFPRVGYALGRLLFIDQTDLYEVATPTTGSSATTLLVSMLDGHGWRFIREGRNVIYAGSNNQGRGEIYKITVEDTTTALNPPTPAAYLPDGEFVYDCRFYAGGVVIATSKGMRTAIADAAGNLDYGPLIRTTSSVKAVEPQDAYVWFGYQGESPGGTDVTDNFGLARMDLSYFVDTLTPAWAPDVMFDFGQTDITIDGAGTLTNGKLVFSASEATGTAGDGIYLRSETVKVASGWFESGEIRFGTTDSKTLRAVEFRCLPLPLGASIAVAYSVNGGAYTTVGTLTTAGATQGEYTIGSVACETVQVKFTLTRGTDTTLSPTLLRWTLRALPTPIRNETFTIPLVMRPVWLTNTGEGDTYPLNIADRVAALKTLERDGTIFEFQVGSETLTGYIENSAFQGEAFFSQEDEERNLGGVYTVQITTVA